MGADKTEPGDFSGRHQRQTDFRSAGQDGEANASDDSQQIPVINKCFPDVTKQLHGASSPEQC